MSIEEMNLNETPTVEVMPEVSVTPEVTVSEEDEKKNRFRFQWSRFNKLGFSLVFFTILTTVAQMLVLMVAQLAMPEELYAKYAVVLQLAPIYVIAFPIFCIIITKWIEKAPKIEQVEKFGAKQFIPCIFMSFAAIGVGSMFATLVNNAAASLVKIESVNVVENLLSGNEIVQNILMVAIVGPIVEELVFRKLLMDRISKYGEAAAIIISAVAFGIFHGNLAQIIYATMLGLVLGYTYAKSGKIIFPIICHMLVNFCSGVMSSWIMQLTNIVALEDEAATITDAALKSQFVKEHMSSYVGYYAYYYTYLAVLLVGVIFMVVFIVKTIKKAKKGVKTFLPGEEQLVKGKRFAAVVGNPGVIIFILIYFFNALIVFFSPLINQWALELQEMAIELQNVQGS